MEDPSYKGRLRKRGSPNTRRTLRTYLPFHSPRRTQQASAPAGEALPSAVSPSGKDLPKVSMWATVCNSLDRHVMSQAYSGTLEEKREPKRSFCRAFVNFTGSERAGILVISGPERGTAKGLYMVEWPEWGKHSRPVFGSPHGAHREDTNSHVLWMAGSGTRLIRAHKKPSF
jgi:hypothetical protein